MNRALTRVPAIPRPLVECHRNEGWIASDVVARKIGVKHNRLLEKVEIVATRMAKPRGQKLSPKSAHLRGVSNPPKYRFEARTYRGQTYDVALMNEPFFTRVIMRFETARARDWQDRFIDQFFDMRSALADAKANADDPAWLAGRAQGKITRRAETDAIADFVEYATAQGSQNAKHYFGHLTRATYRALGVVQGRGPGLRSTVDGLATARLMLAEDALQRTLRKHMSKGLPYREVYHRTADDLDRFCAGFNAPAA